MKLSRARLAVISALLIAPACTIGSMTADATPSSGASANAAGSGTAGITAPVTVPGTLPLDPSAAPLDPSAAPVDGVDLAASFAELEAAVGAPIGVAVVPVGGGAAQVFGSQATQVAWSTIKVPLAIAALNAGTGSSDTVASAIVNSDNDAAQSLWDGLGGGEAAAAAVQTVLAAGGDSGTSVEPSVLREGFTAFGQTQWSLPAQATFTANLCKLGDSADTVLGYMSEVAGNQQWGVQPYGAPVKGGWGPLTDGSYLVRQLGIVTNTGGASFAVALSTSGGSFESGAAVLTQVGAWIDSNRDAFAAGSC